jgi:hypothetical protein
VPVKKVDQIVEELLEKPLTREQRIALLRQLVREGKDLPDSFLEEALERMLERLAEG